MCCFSIILFPNLSTYCSILNLVRINSFIPCYFSQTLDGFWMCPVFVFHFLVLADLVYLWPSVEVVWRERFPQGTKHFPGLLWRKEAGFLVTHFWHINIVEIDCMHLFLNYSSALYFPDCSWFKPLFSAVKKCCVCIKNTVALWIWNVSNTDVYLQKGNTTLLFWVNG